MMFRNVLLFFWILLRIMSLTPSNTTRRPVSGGCADSSQILFSPAFAERTLRVGVITFVSASLQAGHCSSLLWGLSFRVLRLLPWLPRSIDRSDLGRVLACKMMYSKRPVELVIVSHCIPECSVKAALVPLWVVSSSFLSVVEPALTSSCQAYFCLFWSSLD